MLTEAGRIALDRADKIFRAADDLTATLGLVGARRQILRVGALATRSRNFQLAFLRPLTGRDDVEVILRSGPQESFLRGLEALALDVVLTNLIPARDAASPYLVHRIAEQPVSLVCTPARLPAVALDVAQHAPGIAATAKTIVEARSKYAGTGTAARCSAATW